MDILNKLIKYFESEEGEKSVKEYFDKLDMETIVLNNQIDRLKNSGKFSEMVEKTITKYNTKNYKNRWYGRGIEPPEYLFWFFLNYSEKYGRECDDKEFEKYANTFTSKLYFCDGYYFNKMDGQGSVVKIIKKEK
jgi:hypothetical protein